VARDSNVGVLAFRDNAFEAELARVRCCDLQTQSGPACMPKLGWDHCSIAIDHFVMTITSAEAIVRHVSLSSDG